jgi:magnesium-transporting ATPase (P-type)
MVVEDLAGKEYLVNIFVPIIYWSAVLGENNFAISAPIGILIFGMVLGAIQLYMIHIFPDNPNGTRRDKTNRAEKILMNRRWTVFIWVVILYGFSNFVYMLFNQKSALIWFLIAIYAMGFGYFILSSATNCDGQIQSANKVRNQFFK